MAKLDVTRSRVEAALAARRCPAEAVRINRG
jgi:hypothetical protein